MKKLLCLMLSCAAIVGLFCFSACSKSSGSFQYKEKGKAILRVGTECDYAPFNWTQMNDENGAIPIMDQEGYYAAG